LATTPPPEHEHGGEYQPAPFGAQDSLDDIRAEGPAVGCMLVYLFVVIVVAAEFLRYFTGTAVWWPLLIAIPFFFPRVWAAFRLWQSPQLMDTPDVSRLSFRDRRLWLVLAVVLMIAEFELQLFWPRIEALFSEMW
jgi:hypothetical protein